MQANEIEPSHERMRMALPSPEPNRSTAVVAGHARGWAMRRTRDPFSLPDTPRRQRPSPEPQARVTWGPTTRMGAGRSTDVTRAMTPDGRETAAPPRWDGNGPGRRSVPRKRVNPADSDAHGARSLRRVHGSAGRACGLSSGRSPKGVFATGARAGRPSTCGAGEVLPAEFVLHDDVIHGACFSLKRTRLA